MSVIEKGDVVTLVGIVTHYDSSDNTFQLDLINPVDSTDREPIDSFVSTNYVCRPSPSAFVIERAGKVAKLRQLQQLTDQLQKEIESLSAHIGD